MALFSSVKSGCLEEAVIRVNRLVTVGRIRVQGRRSGMLVRQAGQAGRSGRQVKSDSSSSGGRRAW